MLIIKYIPPTDMSLTDHWLFTIDLYFQLKFCSSHLNLTARVNISDLATVLCNVSIRALSVNNGLLIKCQLANYIIVAHGENRLLKYYYQWFIYWFLYIINPAQPLRQPSLMENIYPPKMDLERNAAGGNEVNN